MKKRKGIILSGGLGTRLFPVTKVVSKQLLPIYDKPMIYYSLSVLMLANIKEILIITTQKDIELYKNLLKDGRDWGVKIDYAIQKKPEGLAQAFIIGERFLNNSPSALILGDNIFHGVGLEDLLIKTSEDNSHEATVFACHVKDPKRYGIVNFSKKNIALNIDEKPNRPKSNYAVTGLYFYDNKASYYAKKLKPSKRGELEITDLNRMYLKTQKLNVVKLGRGYSWLDAGTHVSMLEASMFIYNMEKRHDLKIACLEEIALRKKWISKGQFNNIIKPYLSNDYGNYLNNLNID